MILVGIDVRFRILLAPSDASTFNVISGLKVQIIELC
jgi:hypothetical protein